MKSKYTSEQVARLIQRLVVINVQWDPTETKIEPVIINQTRCISHQFAEYGFQFDASFSSPDGRALLTEDFALGEQEPSLNIVHELRPTRLFTKRDALGEKVNALGRVSYGEYRRVPEIGESLCELGEVALEVILDTLTRAMPVDPQNCVVFGHAPLIQGLVHALLKAGNPDGSVGNQELVLYALNPRAGEGLSLRFHNLPEYTGYWFEHHIIQPEQTETSQIVAP